MPKVMLETRPVRVNNIFCIGRNYVDHIAELKNETPTEPPTLRATLMSAETWPSFSAGTPSYDAVRMGTKKSGRPIPI